LEEKRFESFKRIVKQEHQTGLLTASKKVQSPNGSWPFIKDFHSQGEGVCPVRTFLDKGGKGLFQMWSSALFGEKTSDSLKFMACLHRHGERGFNQCGQEGKRSIFRDFVRTSFMDGPLWNFDRMAFETKR